MTAPVDRAELEKAIVDTARITSDGSWYFTPNCYDHLRTVIAAARAHLDTLPKTKMVEVWRVEFAQVRPGTLATWEACSAAFPDRAEAEIYAGRVKVWSCTSCIKVTGPHQQEIPQ